MDSAKIKPKCLVLKPEIKYFDSVTSTNEVAWKEYVSGNLIVISDSQISGKGRFARNWFSPAGENIYLSIVLKPQISLDKIHIITSIGALAVLDTVSKFTSYKPYIIFPNDIYIYGKKIAGVLAESRLGSGVPEMFVLGIGMNINSEKFPDDLLNKATSLKLLENRFIEREIVIETLIEQIDHYYGSIESNIYEIYEKWRSNSFLIGKTVKIHTNTRSFIEGILVDSDPVDGVLIKTSNGTVIRYRFEDIQQLIYTA